MHSSLENPSLWIILEGGREGEGGRGEREGDGEGGREARGEGGREGKGGRGREGGEGGKEGGEGSREGGEGGRDGKEEGRERSIQEDKQVNIFVVLWLSVLDNHRLYPDTYLTPRLDRTRGVALI